MSTLIKKFFITATTILMVCLSISLVYSQRLKASIEIVSPENEKVLIEGMFTDENIPIGKNWSFISSYADAENLGKRIENLKLFDKSGQEILYKKFADGEYVADEIAKRFSYEVNVRSLNNVAANAHVSWIKNDHGLLMLNDLLPRFSRKDVHIGVTVLTPKDWSVSTNHKSFLIEKVYEVNDHENAIFFVGKDWREREIKIENSSVKFLILDEWQFRDELAFEMAEEILNEYVELFGEMPVKNAQIVLMRFPEKMDLGRWRAETRGVNVTILSSKALAESFAKQRLHEQLRHEIFHLWIPNSLDLEGDYAWFYEGFAIYQALKTGVNLGQIRFEDFLNTLEQAYFLDQKRSGNNSLIDISKMRWNGEVSSVYAKGMLVAFLCDAAILEKSKGKRDVKNLFRSIYQKHGRSNIRLVHRNKESNTKLDANQSILKVLDENEELAPIIAKYIKGKEKIDWAKYLAVFGIENIGSKTNANLRLKSKLSGRQKALLRKLGYNKRRNFKKRKFNRNQ